MLSSPRYPQFNGEVERAVQTIKNILKKENELQKALLAYKKTHLRSGYSPAELLIGRRLRSAVPTVHESLIPRWPDMDKAGKREYKKDATTTRTFQYQTKSQIATSIVSRSISSNRKL